MIGGAAASEPHVAQAARDTLSWGNAADAVVAGVLAAAAEAATVLLGPVQVLVGGAGSALLAFDGRVRQPGKRAPRPRGFLPGEIVPETARVPVPMLPATIPGVVAAAGSGTLQRVCGPAISLAKQRSPERASVLEAFSRRGAPEFTVGFTASELIVAAGRAVRGLLTPTDLASMRPIVVRCQASDFETSGLLLVPWASTARRALRYASADGPAGEPLAARVPDWDSADFPDGSFTHVVAAADARGLVAVACYEAPPDGLPIPSLGLLAPPSASPVMRGSARVAPGDARLASAPMGLRSRLVGVDLAVGIALARGGERRLVELVQALDETPTAAVAQAAAGGGRPVVLVRTRDAARVLAGS